MRIRGRLGAPLAVAAGITLGLAMALLLRAERRLGAEPSSVLGAVSDSLGQRVDAERVSISYWPPGVVASGVHVSDESPLGPGSLLRADELELRASLWALLRGRLVVDEVRLLRPSLRLVRGSDGRWNTERRRRAPRSPSDRSAARTPAVEVQIETLRVRGGRIRYRDRASPGGAEIEVDDLNLLIRHHDGLSLDFNASALGGKPESVAGGVRIPPLGRGRRIEVELRGTSLDAARLPEFLAVLEIPVPFALELGGRLDLRAKGSFAPVWPAAGGEIRLEVDALQATASAARGWMVKSLGTPARLSLDLDRETGAWWLERALLETQGLRLSARVDGLLSEPGATIPDALQPPLRFGAESVRVEDLSAWFPALAALSPSGEVHLEGRLEPTADGLAVDLGLGGGRLRLQAGDRSVALRRPSLRVRAEPRSLRGHASASEVAFGELSATGLLIDVDGIPGDVVHLAASARAPGRSGSRLDEIALAGAVDGRRLELPWLELRGLGGFLSGSAQAVRREGGHVVLFEPRFQDVDAGALLRLLGAEERVLGVLSGRATLVAQGKDAASLAANLGGEYEIHLENGSLVGINPGRALIDELGRLPGLRGAIESRAREHAPELLDRSVTVSSLYGRGSFARGEIKLDALHATTRLYEVEVSGRAAFDGEVDLEGRLALHPSARDALLPSASRLGLGRAALRELDAPVRVRGRLPDPSIILSASGAGGRDESPGGTLLQRWLGRGR